jgi:hypothetical protein
MLPGFLPDFGLLVSLMQFARHAKMAVFWQLQAFSVLMPRRGLDAVKRLTKSF